jgi:RNA polymerase-associated protein CTR9
LQPQRLTCPPPHSGIQTDIDLDTLHDPETADAIPFLLADYAAECKDWTLLAGEHWRQGRFDMAEELLKSAVTCEWSSG